MHWVWEANGSAWSLGVSMCRFVSWHLQPLKDPSPCAVAGLRCWPRQAGSLLQRAVWTELPCWGQRMKPIQRGTGKGTHLSSFLPHVPVHSTSTVSLSICPPSKLRCQWPRPDVGRTEPSSLWNTCTDQINVRPPLLLPFGKIAQVWFLCLSQGHMCFHVQSLWGQ